MPGLRYGRTLGAWQELREDIGSFYAFGRIVLARYYQGRGLQVRQLQRERVHRSIHCGGCEVPARVSIDHGAQYLVRGRIRRPQAYQRVIDPRSAECIDSLGAHQRPVLLQRRGIGGVGTQQVGWAVEHDTCDLLRSGHRKSHDGPGTL